MRLENGYGSIYKVGGHRRKPWICRLPYSEQDRINGLKRQTLGYYKTKTEALTALAEYHKDPTHYLNKNIYLNNVYELWSVNHFKIIKENTARDTKVTYKNIEPLCKIPINEIKLFHIQKLIDSLKPSVAKKTKILLNQLFSYALINDMITKNYMSGVVLPKIEPKIKRILYTREEIDLLWEHSDNLYSQYALIQLYTGMRISEVMQLKKENIFLHERYAIGGLKTKAGTNRTIPLCKRIMPLIEQLYNCSTTERLMNDFRTNNTVIRLSKKFMRKIGITVDHNTHDCRYTFASLMEEAGVPLLTTQKIMGHSAGNLTQDLYTKKDIQTLLDAVDKLR